MVTQQPTENITITTISKLLDDLALPHVVNEKLQAVKLSLDELSKLYDPIKDRLHGQNFTLYLTVNSEALSLQFFIPHVATFPETAAVEVRDITDTVNRTLLYGTFFIRDNSEIWIDYAVSTDRGDQGSFTSKELLDYIMFFTYAIDKLLEVLPRNGNE